MFVDSTGGHACCSAISSVLCDRMKPQCVLGFTYLWSGFDIVCDVCLGH